MRILRSALINSAWILTVARCTFDSNVATSEHGGALYVAFGSGIHRCAGSNLARLEMTTALSVWLERIPEFSLRDGEAMEWAGGQVRGPRVMPFEFPAGSRR